VGVANFFLGQLIGHPQDLVIFKWADSLLRKALYVATAYFVLRKLRRRD